VFQKLKLARQWICKSYKAFLSGNTKENMSP
jgi:hypothetical protein